MMHSEESCDHTITIGYMVNVNGKNMVTMKCLGCGKETTMTVDEAMEMVDMTDSGQDIQETVKDKIRAEERFSQMIGAAPWN